MTPNQPTSTIGRILASRKVWVALGAVALTVAAAFGVPKEKLVPIIAAITTLASVVIAAIGYEDASAKRRPDQVAPQPPRPDSPSMNGLAWFCAALAAVIIAGGAGCQSPSGLQQTVAARELYTGTLNVLSDARELGRIDDAAALQIERYRREAAAALDILEQAALAGEPATSQAEAFTKAIEPLLRWRIQVEARK